mmetsp:Transcript_58479/g.181622  ORF Transcript_58479/g.181622 Transcript_58479/m.181622 type:complete len:203 (-) Transcript_58479:248-856(-)
MFKAPGPKRFSSLRETCLVHSCSALKSLIIKDRHMGSTSSMITSSTGRRSFPCCSCRMRIHPGCHESLQRRHSLCGSHSNSSTNSPESLMFSMWASGPGALRMTARSATTSYHSPWLSRADVGPASRKSLTVWGTTCWRATGTLSSSTTFSTFSQGKIFLASSVGGRIASSWIVLTSRRSRTSLSLTRMGRKRPSTSTQSRL